MTRPGRALSQADRALIEAARAVLRKRFDAPRHVVSAAVRTGTGAVYLGLNLDGIHAPCAEPVAIGSAITAGDGEIVSMVAVTKKGREFPVISPCGTCRQLLFDYAPRASVILRFSGGRLARFRATESLPGAFGPLT